MDNTQKIILGLASIAMVYGAGSTIVNLPVNNDVSNLETALPAQENAYFAANGHYQTITPTTTPNGVKYKVDTIIKWDGTNIPESQSYQIVIMKPDYTQEFIGNGALATTSPFVLLQRPLIKSGSSTTPTSTITTLQ